MPLFLLLVIALGAPVAASGQTPAKASTIVTSVAQGLVYIAAGRADGLKEGTPVVVTRLGDKGRYAVLYLSSHSAACQGDSTSVLPSVGDTVTFVPVAPSARDEARYGADGRRLAERRAGPRLRGRLGVRYLESRDPDGGVGLKQPGIEISLDGPVARGAPLGLSVDIRSRRTTTYRPGESSASQGLMGVYQAAMRVQSLRGPVRAVIGRQYAPTLAGVGLFDGLLLDLQHERWGVGVLAGFEPELGTLALSSEVHQLGGFVQGRSGPSSRVHWSLSAGGIGSYAGGEVNREFGFVQATLNTRAISAVVLQELDLNRGWKLAAGEARFAPTSTFLSVNLMPASWLSFSGGLDNRRNVRLYRDLANPEQLFDDRFRFGLWGGTSLVIARHLRLGGDVRTSSVENADSLTTRAVSANVSLDRVTPLGMGFRARVTRYETPGHGPGLLYAGGVRLAPGVFGSVELQGGARTERAQPGLDRFWLGVDLDVLVRRSWFGIVSVNREWGRDNLTPRLDQLYAGLSFRF